MKKRIKIPLIILGVLVGMAILGNVLMSDEDREQMRIESEAKEATKAQEREVKATAKAQEKEQKAQAKENEQQRKTEQQAKEREAKEKNPSGITILAPDLFMKEHEYRRLREGNTDDLSYGNIRQFLEEFTMGDTLKEIEERYNYTNRSIHIDEVIKLFANRTKDSFKPLSWTFLPHVPVLIIFSQDSNRDEWISKEIIFLIPINPDYYLMDNSKDVYEVDFSAIIEGTSIDQTKKNYKVINKEDAITSEIVRQFMSEFKLGNTRAVLEELNYRPRLLAINELAKLIVNHTREDLNHITYRFLPELPAIVIFRQKTQSIEDLSLDDNKWFAVDIIYLTEIS